MLMTALLLPAVAWAQVFGERPARLVVPFPPGGGVDTLARTVAPRVSEILGQPIVIDNRSGAAGVIGVEIVARSAPDGHTIVVASSGNMSIVPTLNPKQMSYKPMTDLAPVSMGVRVSSVLVVHPSLPAASVKELIALARANPGKYAFASGGSGTVLHLAGELFKLQAKIDLLHVPYKGTGPAITDLIAGQVLIMFSDPAVLTYVKAGRLRGLAQTSAARAPSIPDLPTIAESGLAGYNAVSWYGFFVTGATPVPIVEKLNGAFVRALKMPEVVAQLTASGMDAAPSSPSELRQFLKEDIDRWARVIREAGLQDK
jgi:tripartite-type tricarboxylate transporter receptor subunit TctC